VRLLGALGLALVIVIATDAASSHPVRVNEGIAGIRLGMTKAQVAARLGKPYAMSIAVGHVACGMYTRVEDFSACFDTRTGRVVSTSGIGRAFCVVLPRFCFGTVGGVGKLKRYFGPRLLGPVRTRPGDLFYEYIGKRGSSRVQSAFTVDTVSPAPFRGSAVTAAYIGLCGRQGGYVPRCPRQR
jgi:hypothetical protein